MGLSKASLRSGGALLVASIALTGCPTHFNAVRVPTSNSAVPLVGAPYTLPFTQYEIVVSRRLAACTNKNADGDDEAQLVLAMVAKPKASEKPDPLRNYVIDFESLQSVWRTSETEVKWNDVGGLESVSASAVDKVGPIAVSVATSIAKIAVAGITAAAQPEEPIKGKPPEILGACNQLIAPIVNHVKDKEAAIETLTAEILNDTQMLNTLNSVSTTMGKDWPVAEKRAYAKLQIRVREKTELLAVLQKKLETDLKKITVTNTVVWPPDGATFGKITEGQSVEAIEILPALSQDVIKNWGSTDNLAEFQAKTRVLAKIVPSSSLGKTDECITKCVEDDIKGLKYRPRSPGYLLVCKGVNCQKDDDDAIGMDEGLISQLGRVYVIPLKSGVFSSKAIAATFDKAGQPTMVGVKSSASTAEGAAVATASILELVENARTKIAGADLGRINTQTALYKAKKDLALARNAMEPDPNEELTTATAAFTADTTLIQARLANKAAHAALDASISAETP